MTAPVVDAKTYHLYGKVGSNYDSRFPNGLLEPDQIWDQKYNGLLAACRKVGSVARYVDPFGAGSDVSGDGSLGSPWATIVHGLANMSGGDELIVRGSGVVTNNDGFVINDHAVALPSGLGRNARTIVRAENRFAITLKWDNSGRNFYGEAIRLYDTSYLFIDGFRYDWQNDSGDPESIVDIPAQENIVTRCHFRKNKHFKYGGLVRVTGKYSLLQDCAGCGVSRYMFETGSTDTPNSTLGYNTFRRCIARVDYVHENQPKAAFSHYGPNSTSNYQYAGHTVYQNCFVIDSKSDWPDGFYGYSWGGWYHPKYSWNIRHQGCGVFNSGSVMGFWLTDNNVALTSLVEDCAVIGEDTGVVDQIHQGNRIATVTPTLNTLYIPPYPMGAFWANNNGVYRRLTAWGIRGAAFNNGMVPTASNGKVTEPPSGIYDPNGADLRYCYGTFGSVYDDPGHDLLTTDPLFLGAYPYEAYIRDWFRTSTSTVPTPSYYPTSCDPLRGFCANDQTLTRYLAGITGGNPDDILAGLY